MNRIQTTTSFVSLSQVIPVRLVCVLVAMIFGLVLFDTPAPAQKTDDQVFVEGLRSRQLFQLAEKHISLRLANKDISPTDQGNLIIELIQTRVGAAVLADNTTRDESWAAAVAIGDDFLKNRSHPRELVIRVQSELARLAQGKFISQQLAAGIPGNDLRNQAIKNISEARRGLEKIDREIALAIPNAGSGPDALKAEELRSLKKHVQYQLANCNLQAAKLFKTEEQGNRVDALLQVLQRLEQVGSQTNSTMPLWWNIQIDRVETYRLQGKLEQAIQELNKLSTKEILSSDRRKSDMLRQQIELALDLGRGDPVQLVTAARLIKQTTPELDLSVVRLMMQTGSSARQPAERDKWQQAATVMTKTIEQTHGAYWGRLAELAVIGDSGNGTTAPTTSTNLDILIRVGDEAWRKENYDDAIKAFDKAYARAMTDGNDLMAMTAGMKSAKIREQEGDNRDAGKRLIKIANENSNHESAAAAHLSGVWNLGRAAAKEKALIDEYAEQLTLHITKWPEAKSVAQARIWLGRYQGSRQQWREAFETLIAVPSDSPLLIEAAKLLPMLAEAEVKKQRQSGHSTQQTSQEFSLRMSEKLGEAGVGPNDRWTSATRQLLLATVRFSLKQNVGDSKALADLLKRAAIESDDAEPAWQQMATAWLIVAKASQSDSIAEAVESVQELAAFNERVLAECFDGVLRLNSSASEAQLNELKLKLIDAALPHVDQDVAARNRWMSRKSMILVNAGRGEEAIQMLRQLIQQSPRRADLQVAMAKALTAADGEKKAALLQWRKVAAGSKQYSANWFEAKYFVAKLLAESGKKEEAKKLLDYLNIPPGWKESELKGDFDRLYSELNR